MPNGSLGDRDPDPRPLCPEVEATCAPPHNAELNQITEKSKVALPRMLRLCGKPDTVAASWHHERDGNCSDSTREEYTAARRVRAYLMIIDRDPETVIKILRAASRRKKVA
jgi:hypothetical protein